MSAPVQSRSMTQWEGWKREDYLEKIEKTIAAIRSAPEMQRYLGPHRLSTMSWRNRKHQRRRYR